MIEVGQPYPRVNQSMSVKAMTEFIKLTPEDMPEAWFACKNILDQSCAQLKKITAAWAPEKQ